MALDRPDQEPKTQLVCYGTLFDIRAACPNGFALDKAQFKKIKKPDAPIKLFKIATSSSHVTIQSPDGNDTALLDLRSASCLRNLQERGATEFKGVIGRFPREPSNTSRNENISQDKSQLNVSVNVYGPIDFASRIGEYLLQEKHYLQHPDALESRITYHNPQCFRSPSITEVRNFTNHCIVDGLSDSSITADLSKIMDTLDVEEESEVISPIRIVVTPLLKHQRKALGFMIRREHGIPPHHSPSEDHNESLYSPDTFPLSGLLADDMGLGKTLSILSNITNSIDEAFRYEHDASSVDEARAIYPRRATLIVVPSAQVLEVWKSEIDSHLKPSTINVTVFHGSERNSMPNEAFYADIILTTYSTLMKDYMNAKLLYKFAWYRVVLDEAHWIRNQNTEQFRATHSLMSRRRWCVTGTPIQNKMEDLAALMRFLKIEPFLSKGSSTAFRSLIDETLVSSGKDPYYRLRFLLETFCLRRLTSTETKLKAGYETRLIDSSATERLDYEAILNDAKSDMNVVVSTAPAIQKFSKLFSVIHKLRRFCNHGDFGKVSSPSPSSLTTLPASLDARTPIDVECDVCQRQDSVDLIKDCQFCPSCSRLLAPEFGPAGPALLVPRRAKRKFSEDFEETSFAEERFLPNHRLPRSEAYPSKLRAVVQDLRKHQEMSKSIVFSCWTRTLDIFSAIMTEQGVTFLRIDGDVSYQERSKRLKQFQESPNVSTLLMTFGTGAVGLNLTAANRIHIVEPQWNPNVEAQAIGRALRLGQQKNVTVIRYIMQGTIEQRILKLQEKKQHMMKFAFDGGGHDSMSDKLEVAFLFLSSPSSADQS